MIRVHFAEREPVDLDANELEFTAAGGVVLRRVEFRQITDPENLQKQRLVASNPQLVDAYSAAAKWTRVENLDLNAEVGPSPAALEVLNA